ncbi:hypothetical protein ACC760_39140, partial [Rhizobium ruizarguesonis]
ADRFLALVAAAQVRDIRLTSIQAGLLVSADLGIARDSRAFARLLGIAHSLVLRELNVLAERAGVFTPRPAAAMCNALSSSL